MSINIKSKVLAEIALLGDTAVTTVRIAAALGVAAGSVARAIQEMTASGRIEVVRRTLGPGGGTVYRTSHSFVTPAS